MEAEDRDAQGRDIRDKEFGNREVRRAKSPARRFCTVPLFSIPVQFKHLNANPWSVGRVSEA